jgi:hypothetical protein
VNLVIHQALSDWLAAVRDPARGDPSPDAERCRAVILGYIVLGLGWSWVKSYAGDGAFAYCGAFAARCWLAGGLRPEVARKSFASTYRLHRWGAENPLRLVRFPKIQSGDVVTVGDGDYGSHIGLALAWDLSQSALVTVEGNAYGRLPDGSWGEGVVMRVRARSELRAAYRPLKEDLL